MREGNAMTEQSIEALANDEVFDLAMKWVGEGRKVSMATVIETWGSAPRRAGSRMIVDSDGNFAGSVSGGCVEAEVVLYGTEIHDENDVVSHEIFFGVQDEDAWEVGLACGGSITVRVERLDADLVTKVMRLRKDRIAFALVDGYDSNAKSIYKEGEAADGHPAGFEEVVAVALRTDEPGTVELDGKRMFVEPFNPSPRLVIVGAVHIAQALVGFADKVGFEPHVVDPRDSWASDERFPGVTMHREWPEEAFAGIGIDARTAVVSLTHDPKIDDPALVAALASPARYVGALGSKRTHGKRVERLREDGVKVKDIKRIDAPVGLDIGAASPSEIALSIMAQVVKSFRKTD